jgi:NADH dehydrogenase FAD-containing subunit
MTDSPKEEFAMARPRIVIVGAGFGGLSAAHGLAGVDADVTLIDRRNYHLFQPLLYQVATAGLSPAQIAQPIRSILRDAANVHVVLGKVNAVDKERRTVALDDRAIDYDVLVLAMGSRHSYFGRDDWESTAPGLKKIDDATDIRRRILTAFEEAEQSSDPAARRRLLTFVVIGAGPTGVEMAGAIAELAHIALRRDFRVINPREARIVLVEAGPRVLASFPAALSKSAQHSLERLHVEVRLGTPVSHCDETGVTVGAEHLPAATIVWAAGVASSSAAKWLGVERDRVGRVMVGPDLAVPGYPEIFVIGDTAHVRGPDGQPLPGLAPAAKQQGAYVARLLRARLAGKKRPGPFRYRNYGTMATIGRHAAVADFGWLRLDGTLAWLMWGLIHVSFLIGFRNRMIVMLDWIWSYVTFRSGARLITGADSH